MKKNIKILAALLIASATFVACSSSDDIAENNQQPVETPAAPKVYTMTVQASKGDDATTRALTLSGSTLNATWATTENVYVKKGSDWADGSLQPQAGGTTATLKGKLSKVAINPNDELTLQFPRSGAIDYTGQVGTLDNIAANYDYATASVTVASVNDGNITAKDDANFVNQQAIIKFTLLDAPINPSAFTITDGTSTVELTGLSLSTNVLYVAFPAAGSAKTVTLTATVGGNTYIYSKSGVTFTNGKYYEITVKMYERDVDLSSLNTNFTARDGQVLSGTPQGHNISIADGATVTLDNVNISSESYCIKCEGDATIILKDGSTNTLTCLGKLNANPALWAGESGKTLTIKGTGGIVATGGSYYAAGIGGGGGTCGNIVIEGGFITATGGDYAAGIGSGGGGNCGTITITGGTITATGGSWAAGIGSGGDGGTCGNITIWDTVTKVTATRGSYASPYDPHSSIGAGNGGYCSMVTIDGIENPAQTTSTTLFTNFDSVVSDDGNTWTLTHKKP